MVHPNETPRPSESPVDGGLSLPTDLQGFPPRQQQLHRKTFSIALAQLQEEDENSLNLQARLLIREQKDLGVQFTLQALSQLQPPVSEECLTDVEFAVKTALDEIFNNLLDHDLLGYSDGQRKQASEEEIDDKIRQNLNQTLRVDIEISPDTISLRSHLHSPFDDFDARWASADPNREMTEEEILANLEKDHGRGLIFIRGSFPQAVYDRENRVITFLKPLDPKAEAA